MSEEPFSLQNYLSLLNLVYHVAQALEGKQASDDRIADCQQLAAKFYVHCASIYQLRQGTKLPFPEPRGTNFFDFASIVVLTRAALETYLTFFEVFIEPNTEDEREFHHALWLLSGYILRETYRPTTTDFEAEFKEAQQQIQEMRQRIESTLVYRNLTPKQQKTILRGVRTRDCERLAQNAGFGERTIREIYAYQSSYVHADGLSGTQIVFATTKEKQIQFIETQMSVVMIIMSKFIVDYVHLFPESAQKAKEFSDALRLAEFLAQLAKNLP